MSENIVYKTRSPSTIRLFQGLAGIFFVGCVALAGKLATAPVGTLTTDNARQGWAWTLAAVAAAGLVLAWVHGRRAVSAIKLTQDGQHALIKSASLLEFGEKAWPVAGLRVDGVESGDTKGEEAFSLPRVLLEANDGKRHRRYTLALQNKEQREGLRKLNLTDLRR